MSTLNTFIQHNFGSASHSREEKEIKGIQIGEEKDTCICMFTAALFTIAKTWKQPKCPSRDDWIEKMWNIYTMEYYSAIKKNKIMPFAATWMELETLILSEVSQKEKDKYHMISLISGI